MSWSELLLALAAVLTVVFVALLGYRWMDGVLPEEDPLVTMPLPLAVASALKLMMGRGQARSALLAIGVFLFLMGPYLPAFFLGCVAAIGLHYLVVKKLRGFGNPVITGEVATILWITILCTH